MTWGKELQTLLDFEQQSGITPKALLDQVVLEPELLFFLDVFYELSDYRPPKENGFDPIQLHEVLTYCVFYGIDDIEQRAEIAQKLRALDKVFLKLQREKDPQGKKALPLPSP